MFSSDPSGAGPLLQGSMRPGHRAPALPVQRAASGGEQRLVHRVQTEATQFSTALAQDRSEAHQRPTEEKR